MAARHAHGVALAALDTGRARPQGPVQRQRGGPLVGRQPGVAARQGQPVGLAHRRAPHDRHRDRQVGDHAAHHGQLLEVLLAEVGPAPARQGEQLGHHRGHPVEVPRARRPFEPLAHAVDVHGGRQAAGWAAVHLLAPAGANTSDAPGARGQGHVGVEVAGVGGQVGGVVELQRVDEHRHGHDVALGRGPLDERAVPGVQRAHGGDEADAAPEGALGVEGVGELRGAEVHHRAWPGAVGSGGPATRRVPSVRRGSRRRPRRATRAGAVAGMRRGQGDRRPGAGPGRRRPRSRGPRRGRGCGGGASRVASSPRAAGPVERGGRARARPRRSARRGPGRRRRRGRARPRPPPARTWPMSATRWLEAMHAAAWYAARCSSSTTTTEPPSSRGQLGGHRVAGHGEGDAAAQADPAHLGRGQGHERVQRGPAGMGGEHVEAERPRQVDHDGVGHGHDPAPPPRRWRRRGWR